MEDDYYTTDDERRFDEPAESYYAKMSEDYDFGLDSFERMEYWEEIFTQKLKSIKASSSSSKYDTDQKLALHPVIYEGSEIDMKALHELLDSQGLSGEETIYICNVVRTSIPTLRESLLTTDTKNRLLDTERQIKKLIVNLKGLANEDRKLIPYVESFSNYVDPADFLCEVQKVINDKLQTYFPNGKVKKRTHLRFSHSLGHIWKLKVGQPTVYLGSPFVQFLSICTCTTQEATIKRIRRHEMKRRFKAYAPF